MTNDHIRRLSIHRNPSIRRIPPSPAVTHRMPPPLLHRTTAVRDFPERDGGISDLTRSEEEETDGFSVHDLSEEERIIILAVSMAARILGFPEIIGDFSEDESLLEEEELEIDGYFEPCMSEEEIATAVKVRQCDAAEGEESICVVCQEDLAGEDDRTVGMLRCGHAFHVSCIGQWLRRKNMCPLCKAPPLLGKEVRVNYSILNSVD